MSCVTWCNYEGQIPSKSPPGSVIAKWTINLATFSDWYTNELLKTTYGEAPTYPPDGLFYIGCNSEASSRATPGAELSGGNYSRTQVTFERVSDIQVWNPSTKQSQTADAQWDPILSFTLWDAPTGGNYYAFGNLGVGRTVDAGENIQWPAEGGVMLGLGAVPTGA